MAVAALVRIQKSWNPNSTDTRPAAPLMVELETKPLLIQPHSDSRKDALEPKNAQALSDRNQVVERATRARDAGIANPRPSRPSRTLPSLDSLGIGALRPGREIQKNLRDESRYAAQSLQRDQQRLEMPELPEGAENLLNTRESVYYSFYSRIYEAIAPVWQGRIRESNPWSRVNPGRYTTRVEVTLDREGNLEHLEILAPSLIQEFDRIAIQSWSRLTRFPNPPEGLRDSQGRVRTTWNFTVEVDESSRINYLPPRRS
jgi:TonB family protein